MRYEVDSSEVAGAAALARSSASTIHAEVAGMMGHLLNLQSSWAGQAATGFAEVTEQWRSTQQIVEESLEQISQALDAAATTYADAEEQAQQLFMH